MICKKLIYYLFKRPYHVISLKYNFEIIREYPRESVEFAQKYFNNKRIDCAEIGVLTGVNSKTILENLNVNRIYLIDSYSIYNDKTMLIPDKSDKRLKKCEKMAKKRLKEYSRKTNWIIKPSDIGIKEISKIDFMYIDGNHDRPYIDKDIKNSWKRINDGGILAGHDIDIEDVREAVLKFMNENNLKLYVGKRRDWWFIKINEVKK